MITYSPPPESLFHGFVVKPGSSLEQELGEASVSQLKGRKSNFPSHPYPESLQVQGHTSYLCKERDYLFLVSVYECLVYMYVCHVYMVHEVVRKGSQIPSTGASRP